MGGEPAENREICDLAAAVSACDAVLLAVKPNRSRESPSKKVVSGAASLSSPSQPESVSSSFVVGSAIHGSSA